MQKQLYDRFTISGPVGSSRDSAPKSSRIILQLVTPARAARSHLGVSAPRIFRNAQIEPARRRLTSAS
eukprot:6976644-Pyramimonas_sp.AAC.1